MSIDNTVKEPLIIPLPDGAGTKIIPLAALRGRGKLSMHLCGAGTVTLSLSHSGGSDRYIPHPDNDLVAPLGFTFEGANYAKLVYTGAVDLVVEIDGFG